MSDKTQAPKGAKSSTGDDSVVVKNTDKIDSSVYGDSETAETYVTITKDVIEEFQYPGTKRPAQRVLFAKGQVVAKSTIDALNANVEAAKAADPDNPKLEEYVDSTTLASGTGANAAKSGDKADAGK